MSNENKMEQLKSIVKEMSETMFHIYIDWFLTFRSPLTECEKMAINMYKMMVKRGMKMKSRAFHRLFMIAMTLFVVCCSCVVSCISCMT